MKTIGLLRLMILFVLINGLSGVDAAAAVGKDTDLKDLNWLVGQWQGQVNETAYYENWIQSRPNTIEGSASTVVFKSISR